MKALVLTTVFPSPWQPMHGLFVRERARHLAQIAELQIVAPVPWTRRLAKRSSVYEPEQKLEIQHPIFVYLPGVGKFLDGLFLFFSVLPSAVRLRRTFDFDLIDAHFAYPEGFSAILLGQCFRRPVSVTLRGTLIPLSRYRIRRWLMGWTLRRADRVLAVSLPLARRALEMGVPKERVVVIENGVDAERFSPLDRSEARRRLGLEAIGRLLVSVGHLSSRKGFQRVIEILPALLRAYPDLEFVVVGGPGAEPSNRSQLQRQIAELKLTSKVSLTGARPPDEIAVWLSAADLFVLASDFEGCPNVVWEAMACGCPVVATRVGEVERMVPDYAGTLVDDPEDHAALQRSLATALASDWDRQRIRDWAKRHDWSQVADRVVVEWHTTVEKSSHKGRREATPTGGAKT